MNADVLIIDDDIPVLHGLRRTFREDYNIETAENGAQALEFVANGWTFKMGSQLCPDSRSIYP
jgi:DNA-binding NtrC family response regulator